MPKGIENMQVDRIETAKTTHFGEIHMGYVQFTYTSDQIEHVASTMADLAVKHNPYGIGENRRREHDRISDAMLRGDYACVMGDLRVLLSESEYAADVKAFAQELNEFGIEDAAEKQASEASME